MKDRCELQQFPLWTKEELASWAVSPSKSAPDSPCETDPEGKSAPQKPSAYIQFPIPGLGAEELADSDQLQA